MIKQNFYVTLLSESISERQFAKIVLDALANFGVMDAEIVVRENSPHPVVFGKEYHLEHGMTLGSFYEKAAQQSIHTSVTKTSNYR